MARHTPELSADKPPESDELSEEQELVRKLRKANASYRQKKLASGKRDFLPFLPSQLALILAHAQLSATEKVVWLSVAMQTSSRFGEAVALTVADIAARAGLQERATQLAIKSLIEKGTLQRVFSQGKNRPADYFVIPPEVSAMPADDE